MGPETVGPGIVTIGEDLEGFKGPLTIVVTRFMGPGIAWLLGLPIISVELKIIKEDGGEPDLVTNGIDPMCVGCEMYVGESKDISWPNVT